MKNRLIWGFLAIMLIGQIVDAQVNVTLVLRNPMPSQLSIWEKDRTVLQLIMTTPTAYPDVRVSFTITNSSNTVVGRSKDDNPSMPHYALPVGTTVKYGPDLVSVNAVEIDPSFKSTTTTTSSLPEDSYTFCIKLLDKSGIEIPTSGGTCQPFVVIIPDPPSLINPTDQTVLAQNAQPTFNWTPVVISGNELPKYQLTIAPMFGSQSGRDAIEANTPLFQQTMPVNSYFYSVANPAFSMYPSAVGFAWQVQAQDQDGNPAARNDGKSEIFTFTLQGSGGSSGPITLEPYYPADGDTIPWFPPHIIVRFGPYSDSLSEMKFTLTVHGSDASSYTSSRDLVWPQGPRIGQGWPDASYNDRARYIIADHEDVNGGVVPSPWTANLKRGVRYTWSVSATFTKGGTTLSASTANSSFFVGATPPHLSSPADKSVVDSTGQPVTLQWQSLPPSMLNPPSLVGMGSSMLKTVFKGGASETYKVEVSRDQSFGSVDTSRTETLPPSPISDDSTWGAGTDLFAARSFTLAKLDTGTYYWRASWLDGTTPYAQSPVWSFTIGESTGTSQKKPPPPPQGNCNDPCIATAPTDSQATSGSFTVGGVITIGKFQLTLTKVTSGSGSNLTGEGTIPVPFLKAPMRVSFTGLQVNKSNQVFKGKAEAIQDNSSPIPQGLANQGGQALGLDTSQIRVIYTFASQAQRLVSAFTSSTPTALPIGFDNVIDGERMVIAIIGMTFESTQAKLNALSMFQIPDLGPGVGIGVGARDICFQPGGISTAQGVLYLGTDLGYRDAGSWGFVFKAPAVSDSGTFVEWDCNGFKQLRLEAQTEFPRDWLVPSPDDGVSLVKATFVARIRKAGDWIASANLDKCTISGANGFGLSVTDMYYDHSDVQNPTGMVFPQSYNKSNTGPTWHGFFLKNATVTLPKSLQTFNNSPPQIAVSNMLIDGAGLSADFLATNVIMYPQGNFGSWGASIDTIDVKIVASSLQSAQMSGQIQIPISSQPLVYSALLSRPKDNSKPLSFYFTIQPKDSLKADLWAATLSIDKTSQIQIIDTSGSFLASAQLDGHLWISGNVGNITSSIPGVNFKGVKFQGVKFMSKSPYADAGTWSLASEQHSMAGFPVSLSNISPVVDMQMAKVRVGLQFTLSLNLHGDDTANGISGKTTLAIWGAMPLGGGGAQQFAFDDVELKEVDVHAQISGLTVDGSLILYHHDATFGDGFRGAVTVNYVQVLTGKATAQFGSVNGFRYWYVDAMITLATGLPLGSSGVGLYGFAGGAWYHMTRSNPAIDLHGAANSSDPNSAPADSSKTPGGTNSGITYTPDVNTDLGLKAGITLGTYPSPAMFNCDVTFTVQFVNGGVGLIAFDGNGFFVCPSMDSRKDALVFLAVGIQYDFVQKSFDANFNFWTNNSYKVLFSASGWMNFHADPSNWHLLIGTPNNRNKVTLLSLATVDSYLMAGTDIPAPDFDNFEHKADIEAAIGSPLPSVHAPIAKGPTEGLAFGASASLDTGRQIFLIFFGRFMLGYGFDIAFTRDLTRKCDNTGSNPGINGWYAVGQMYAYIMFQIGLHVDVWFTEGDFTILDMGAGARCILMAPNPIWVQGTVGGHYDILGGLVSGQCSFTFEVGDKCVVSVENPLAAIDLISDMQPADGASNVDVFIVPKAAFNMAIGAPVDIQYVDGDGNQQSKTYRAVMRDFTLARTDNAQSVSGRLEFASDNQSAGFVTRDALEEYTQYTLTVTVYAQEYSGGVWVQSHKRDGSDVVQTRTASFRSGKRPDVILAQNVMYSYPLNRQKFYLQNESHNGALAARASGYLFQEAGTYLARFVPLTSADTTDVGASYDAGAQSVMFGVPTLKNNTVYALQIIRRAPKGLIKQTPAWLASISSQSTVSVKSYLTSRAYTSTGGFASATSSAQVRKQTVPGSTVRSDEKLLYVYYFQTSQFNTLGEKLNTFSFKSLDHNKYWGTHESITAHFTNGEDLDDYDVKGYDVFDGFSSSHSEALVHVDAHAPGESWYTGYVWPTIYSHVLQLMGAGMWDQPLSDQFFLLFGLFNPNQTAYFDGASTGKLRVASVDNKASGSTSRLGGLALGGFLFRGSSLGGIVLGPPDVRVKYVHGDLIGNDYFNLWWKCHAIMMEYNYAGYDDPSSWMYGMKDWIDNNGGWINYYNSMDLNGMTNAYQFMRDDTYALTFIYGPKLTWDAGGPWIKKTFTLGNPRSGVLQVRSRLRR